MEEVPNEFKCPISMEIMKDPVVCEDGHSYERENILNWLERSQTSPMTRQPISKNQLRSNLALKASIERWKVKEKTPKPSAPYGAPYVPNPVVVYQPTSYNGYQTPSYQTPAYYPTQAYSYVPQQPRTPTPIIVGVNAPAPTPRPTPRPTPTPQTVLQVPSQISEQQRKKILALACLGLFFIIILISILSLKTRSTNENDDD